MIDNNILDDVYDSSEPKNSKAFKFQTIEFILIGIFCLINLLKPLLITSMFEDAILFYVLGILIFLCARIYLEYKNHLITSFGIFLKILMLINAASIFSGMVFNFLDWPFFQEMVLITLMSLTFPYLIYALILQKISIPIRLNLGFNALAIGVLAIGMAFSLEHWNYGDILVIIGLSLSIISLFLLGKAVRKELTKKEMYHSINYIGRSFAVLIFYFFTIAL